MRGGALTSIRFAGAVVAMTAALFLFWLPGAAAARQIPLRAEPQGATASVVKGTSASIAAFPWLAHIFYEGEVEASECTGTVVAPRIVLTAGHCAISESGHLLSASNFYVTTGLADLKQASSLNFSLVSQVLLDPGYEPGTGHHDAALLVLSAPVAAPAISLPALGDEELLSAGTGLTIAGWGLTSGSSTKAPTVLREGQTVIQDAAYCHQKVRRFTSFYDPSLQFCVIAAPKFEVSACHGDSGGPGIAVRADGTPVQVGIISMGDPDCRANIPSIETRVDRVATWISAWISAIEEGGAVPSIASPPLMKLPKLSLKEATYLAYLALSSEFREHFRKGLFREIGCRRVEREKAKCKVFWYLAGSVYSGAVTVYYSLPREGSIVNFRYRVLRVSAQCWLRTKNARHCRGTLYVR